MLIFDIRDENAISQCPLLKLQQVFR